MAALVEVYGAGKKGQVELEMRQNEINDVTEVQQSNPHWLEWYRNKAIEKLLQSLPYSKAVDMDDLETRGYARWLALSNVLFYATLLFTFWGTGTMTELNRQFLALNAPKAAEAYCQEIPVAVTGMYQADTKGMWNTQSAYDSSKALYELSMAGSAVTVEQYSRSMRNFTAEMRSFKPENFDIISTHIFMSLFRAKSRQTSMRFRFFADLNLIFSRLESNGPAAVFSSKNFYSSEIEPTYDSVQMELASEEFNLDLRAVVNPA